MDLEFLKAFWRSRTMEGSSGLRRSKDDRRLNRIPFGDGDYRFCAGKRANHALPNSGSGTASLVVRPITNLARLLVVGRDMGLAGSLAP